MRTLFLALPLLVLPLFTGTASAENLACQTVNGQTVCVEGPGALACRSVNGRTSCTHSPNQRVVCDTRQGRTACPSVPIPQVGEDVVVDTRGGRVTVRAGGVVVDLDDDE